MSDISSAIRFFCHILHSILAPSNFLNHLFIWLYHMACGILDPQTGIQPTPPAFKVLGLYYWTAREVPLSDFSFFKQSLLHMNSSMPKAFANSDEQQAVLTPTV